MLLLLAMVAAKGEMRWTRREPPLQNECSVTGQLGGEGRSSWCKASNFGLARRGRFLEGHFEAAMHHYSSPPLHTVKFNHPCPGCLVHPCASCFVSFRDRYAQDESGSGCLSPWPVWLLAYAEMLCSIEALENLIWPIASESVPVS